MKMESLAARRDEIEIRENQLKESLLKFDTFIKVSTKHSSQSYWSKEVERPRNMTYFATVKK